MQSTGSTRSLDEVLQWARSAPRCGHDLDDIMEIYSQPRLLQHTNQRGLKGEMAIDLCTGWDLLIEGTQKKLIALIQARDPLVIMLSPPCTMFSALQSSNWHRMPQATRERRLREAMLHVHFCIAICFWRAAMGRGFVFEHPRRALSWQDPIMVALTQQAYVCDFHMCMFGMVTQDDPSKYHMKPTRLVTNLKAVHKAFSGKTCDKSHKHIPIQGSAQGLRRSTWAQCYPGRFCQVMAGALHEAVQTECCRAST